MNADVYLIAAANIAQSNSFPGLEIDRACGRYNDDFWSMSTMRFSEIFGGGLFFRGHEAVIALCLMSAIINSERSEK